MKKTVGIFLDRDGTINEEVDFLSNPDNLNLIPRSVDAIREANTLGFKVFIITNQSGIARGFLSEERLSEIHKRLLASLKVKHAAIDAIYYCPHHPELGNAPFVKDCDCRKPRIGMLQQAATEFNVDLTRSFVIGDRMIDIQTGNNAGATSILVLTGYGKEELDLCRQNNVPIACIANDLFDAMEFVKRTAQHKQPSIC
ncbi:MAG: D-glycero-beta-D-manno-heptose 1,7-bisphosphate 7-phosphatase [Ignavibacteriae bacterium]|nr:D-glycero-beta-D-manno-heptose 1,7-bisphosphate 7-phosphatase [Ignavibacteria bacterium]MBI3364826.1 D-glycero-beta-D-manno-heptose 1,7-bisphosphate 7-phosphatase [Ignavibacteriota bacterium]